jgi:CheY-like chemotaxis protein
MLRILLVEDNPADAHMLESSLTKTGMPVEIDRVIDGPQALQRLTERNPAEQDYDVVLLDLNLPLMNGLEVLENIRGRDELKKLPVVVMSGSTNMEEIDRCYRAGANSYICKPIHLDEIRNMCAQFMNYWSNCVRLPSKRGANRVGRLAARNF